MEGASSPDFPFASSSPTLRATLKDVGQTSNIEPAGSSLNRSEEWPRTVEMGVGAGASAYRKDSADAARID